MLVMGIDPGHKGGFALLRDGTDPHVWPMPDTLTGILSAFESHGRPDLAIIESVHAMPGQGVCSMFSFGRGVGQLEALLVYKGVPWRAVAPQRWQKTVLGSLPGSEGKRAAIAWIRQQWPTLNLRASPRCKTDHDGMADALAIAFYGFKTLAWLE